MIATRQRPQSKFSIRKLLLPLIAIAALVFALVWAPSQRVIVGVVHPLGPILQTVGNLTAPLVKPIHFAAQEQVIANRNKQVETLNSQLEVQRKAGAAKDAQITALTGQVKQAQQAASQAAAAAAAAVAAQPQPAAAAAAAAPAKSDGTAAAGPAIVPAPAGADPKRVAAVWAAMEPEQAADIAKRLPVSYTARVLGAMSPDSAGAIMGVLPPAYAASVSQVRPR